MKKGNYFGTEIDGKWWKRYRAKGFFARGNGEFTMDEEGIRFLRIADQGATDHPLDRGSLSHPWQEPRRTLDAGTPDTEGGVPAGRR